MLLSRGSAARTVVAISAKNEEGFIEACLAALATQSEPVDDIVVVVNNTTDGTARLARTFVTHLPSKLHVEEVEFSAHWASAGHCHVNWPEAMSYAKLVR